MRVAMVLGVTGLCAAALAACSRSNNLLLGRVEAGVGGHRVVVTDCYRTSVPPPRDEGAGADRPAWRFMPCRDADVLIRGEELLVNGRSYGRLGPHDAVLVDHGRVSIDRPEVRAGAAR
ncbi:MAG: hypothetical protein M3O15_05550 [Acidobacteriota bacterium]|nr:hypothetical protein [Acidobacteriota bacterium]